MYLHDHVTRREALLAALQERILVLDGATGTALQGRSLTADDFGGPELEGCNEMLNLTRPDVVLDVHRGYLRAGCDVVETNTFGGTPLVLAEYGLADQTDAINERAAALARQACDEFSRPGRLCFVAGSIGPTTKAISVTGGVTFEALIEHFYRQALALTRGGADYLLIETCQDTRNIKAALLGIDQVDKTLGWAPPVAISGTIEPMGTMLAGQGVEALYASIQNRPILYLGVNCATGPEFMTDHLRSLAQLSHFPLSCVPNAGLPDDRGIYLETPRLLAGAMERFLEAGWLNVVGGCCGTTAAHIEALAALAKRHRPRQASVPSRSLLSGIDWLEVSEDVRPVLVGERTNVLGSRAFKRLISEGDFDAASEIARRQVKNGAQVIDVGLADPDRNEAEDLSRFLSQVIRKIKAPLMIDSTDANVIALALTFCQGKALINSVNLEEGEARFQAIVPLARRFGAALVVGCIDEDPVQGMAVSRARKLEVALRCHTLLVNSYGMAEEDLYFDPLVFPCATGAAEYVGSAAETIEGIRLIKAALPRCKTVLGISNVSFGLPPAGREVLNAVFLYHCTKAGLDMAIVNTEKLERYASIPEHEKLLSENLLFNRGDDPVGAFSTHFKGAQARTKSTEALPLDARLSRYIVEGVKEGLAADLALKLQESSPLEIINGPLMAGMEEVGRLFNRNELIVAEVLQSAEAMKAAVNVLEPFMEKSSSAIRGTLLLATVKGDVHDIGKNLVDIIFSNNGYRVINLGIKIAPEALIAAAREHKPDLIGLSGLLVKSAQQMVVTASDLRTAGIQAPLLVGGAALSRKFSEMQIQPAYQGVVAYARDAMNGLELANSLRSDAGRTTLMAEVAQRQAAWTEGSAAADAGASASSEMQESGEGTRVRRVSGSLVAPVPPDLERHVQRDLLHYDVWRFLNLRMLFGKHLGLKGDIEALVAARDSRAMELVEVVKDVKRQCAAGAMRIDVVWRFVPVDVVGETVRVLDASGSVLEELHFPRMSKAPGLCLTDYVLQRNEGSTEKGATDHLAIFLTSAGAGVRALAEQWKAEGQYLRCHVLQALALETAEAAAEWLHRRLRAQWGFADSSKTPIEDVLKGRYRGKRYSFGYPACPELADQEKLFRLLDPSSIGVQLTDGFMMEPEASVSALVFHHPEARYFVA